MTTTLKLTCHLLKYISDKKQISFENSHWKYAFLKISKYKLFAVAWFVANI